ncbi:MAG: molybdenum cofactor biosynthesis protein MoaE, partial [Candidatus Competibacter sp.]|nr:molybdenum cofactor biosynthesis protein MoaE [Candidatus Competibacter sp.]
RDFNDGDTVQEMTLEHYPGMTERHLQRIVESAAREWPLLDALLIHRIGALQPNDPIVLAAVWSAQRAEAFAACRFIMEELKSKAPFWKRERTAAGPRWVAHNTPG